MTHNSYNIPLYRASVIYAGNNFDKGKKASSEILSLCKFSTPGEWNYNAFRGSLKKSLETRWLEENDKLFLNRDFTRSYNGYYYSSVFVNVSFAGGVKEYTFISTGSYTTEIVKNTTRETGVADRDIWKKLKDTPLLIDNNGNILAAKYIKRVNLKKVNIPEEARFNFELFSEIRKKLNSENQKKQNAVAASTQTDAENAGIFYECTWDRYFDCYRHNDGYYFLVRNTKPYKNIEVDTDENGVIDDEEKRNALQLRRLLYESGFFIDGHHYVRYKRSAGSSRDGTCLFIAEEFVNRAAREKNYPAFTADMLISEWSNCGLDENAAFEADSVGWEAYRSLTLSGCQSNGPDFVKIKKNEILVLRDGKSYFRDSSVIPVNFKNEENNGIDVLPDGGIEIENTVWDGEGLLDESVFNDTYKSQERIPGMLLLRNRFFKNCAFNTKLQKWFSDNNISDIKELNGVTLAKSVNEIKLVVTESSLKYIKIRKNIDKYLKKQEPAGFETIVKDWLNFLDDTFAIIKTDKPTHYLEGKLVRTNYQLINTLDAGKKDIEELLKPPFDYYSKVDTDPDMLTFHLSSMKYKTKSDENGEDFDEDEDEKTLSDTDDANVTDTQIPSADFNVTAFNLIKANRSIIKAQALNEFRRGVREAMREEWRCGKILVNGTYAVLFGNGYELLKACLKKNWDEKADVCSLADQTSLSGNSIFSKRFADKEQLLCARSPHVTMGNLLYTENHRIEKYDKYFNLTQEIVCVNSIRNNIMDRLNGCDFDSDTMLITNDAVMVRTGKAPSEMPIPYNVMKPEAKQQCDRYKIDSDVSNNLIGNIINLSQKLNCLYWTKAHSCKGSELITQNTDEIYTDICKLAVLSNIEIDKAKRDYGIKAGSEISKISNKYKDLDEKFNTPDFITRMQKRNNVFGESQSSIVIRKDECANKPNNFVSTMTLLYDAVKSKADDDQNPKGKQPTDSERCLSVYISGKTADDLPLPSPDVVAKAKDLIKMAVDAKTAFDSYARLKIKTEAKKEEHNKAMNDFFSAFSEAVDEETAIELIRICDLDMVYGVVKSKSKKDSAPKENVKSRRSRKSELKEKLLKENKVAGYDETDLDVSKIITLLLSAMCYRNDPGDNNDPVLITLISGNAADKAQCIRLNPQSDYNPGNADDMCIYGYKLEYSG